MCWRTLMAQRKEEIQNVNMKRRKQYVTNLKVKGNMKLQIMTKKGNK